MSNSLSQNTPPTKADAFFHELYQRALGMVAANKPAHEVLVCLVTAAEASSGPNTVCSILKLDDQGLLRNGASPNLPADYLSAIDRIRPDAKVGTCAAAAATGSIVLTPDFYEDSKWAELRHLPLALGFVGAWSMPIKNEAGKTLGTFGTYFREKRSPTDVEIKNIELLTAVAAQVLNKSA